MGGGGIKLCSSLGGGDKAVFKLGGGGGIKLCSSWGGGIKQKG